MITDYFRVPEISGDLSVRAITKAVSSLTGVQRVVVDLSEKSVRVDHDGRAGIAAIMRAIADAGYGKVFVLA